MSKIQAYFIWKLFCVCCLIAFAHLLFSTILDYFLLSLILVYSREYNWICSFLSIFFFNFFSFLCSWIIGVKIFLQKLLMQTCIMLPNLCCIWTAEKILYEVVLYLHYEEADTHMHLHTYPCDWRIKICYFPFQFYRKRTTSVIIKFLQVNTVWGHKEDLSQDFSIDLM